MIYFFWVQKNENKTFYTCALLINCLTSFFKQKLQVQDNDYLFADSNHSNTELKISSSAAVLIVLLQFCVALTCDAYEVLTRKGAQIASHFEMRYRLARTLLRLHGGLSYLPLLEQAYCRE